MRADQPVSHAGPMAHAPAREKAYGKTGLFANQNSVTKLRNRFTLEQLTAKSGPVRAIAVTRACEPRPALPDPGEPLTGRQSLASSAGLRHPMPSRRPDRPGSARWQRHSAHPPHGLTPDGIRTARRPFELATTRPRRGDNCISQGRLS
jgi:hypothetical protein